MRLWLVRFANASDVLGHELEVEDVDVLADALRRDGSRNYGSVAVQVPLDRDRRARDRLQMGIRDRRGATELPVTTFKPLGARPKEVLEMVQDIEAFTAALLARRPDLASQENASLLSDISAAFRDYAERMGDSQQVDSAQNADGHRDPGSDRPL